MPREGAELAPPVASGPQAPNPHHAASTLERSQGARGGGRLRPSSDARRQPGRTLSALRVSLEEAPLFKGTRRTCNFVCATQEYLHKVAKG